MCVLAIAQNPDIVHQVAAVVTEGTLPHLEASECRILFNVKYIGLIYTCLAIINSNLHFLEN